MFKTITVFAWIWMTTVNIVVAAEKNYKLIKIGYVNYSIGLNKDGQSGDLRSISFSIQNLANQDLEWIRLRATIKSYAGELIQTETFEEKLIGKFPKDKGLGSKEVRQFTHYVDINGFKIMGKTGSVDIAVIDYRLSMSDSERAAFPRLWRYRDTGAEITVYLQGDYIYQEAEMQKDPVKVQNICKTKRDGSEWSGSCVYSYTRSDSSLNCSVETKELITLLTATRIEGKSQLIDTSPLKQQPQACPKPGTEWREFFLVPKQ